MANPNKPHDREQGMTGKLTNALILLIVGALLLASVAPTLDRLIAAVTPLILVIGALAIAWKLTQYFTRN